MLDDFFRHRRPQAREQRKFPPRRDVRIYTGLYAVRRVDARVGNERDNDRASEEPEQHEHRTPWISSWCVRLRFVFRWRCRILGIHIGAFLFFVLRIEPEIELFSITERSAAHEG